MSARVPVQSSKFKVQGPRFFQRGARNAERGKASVQLETQNSKPETASLARPLLRWFASHARDLPWRHTLDPYGIWISEIMLQQTQVKTVIPYYERWLRELPNVRALATATPERVLKLWEGLGYYTRARNLQRAAQQIIREHGGEFPCDFRALLALPGIGRYTAGAIASIAFNQPAPIVDGNVIRVITRLFAIRENPRDKAVNTRLWELAGQLAAAAGKSSIANYRLRAPMVLSGPCSALNQSLMELGATVCTARQPACAVCPLRTNCAAHAQGLVGQLPNLGARVATTVCRSAAFVILRRGKVLVRQRPAGMVNAHLWEFPNVDMGSGMAASQERLHEHLGFAAEHVTKLCTIKHSITRYRITVEAVQVQITGRTPRLAGRWLPVNDLDALAFTASHRKILRYLHRTNNHGIQR